VSSFNEFSLSDCLLKALEHMKFTLPTPVQEKTIPLATSGADLIASAQTGTGKTAAYGIPLVEALLSDQKAQALVLAPTRELADQILNALRQLSAYCPRFGSVLLIGGQSMYRQRQELLRKPRIMVATPGRLVDHLRTQPGLLSNASYLVLDEADRMLDLGFRPQLEVIRKTLPLHRQTLLFSATFPADIAQLAREWTQNAQRVSIGPVSRPADDVTQDVVQAGSEEKNDLVLSEVEKRQGAVLVFARTKRRTDRLASFLRARGVAVCRIHGDRSQNQREEALNGFRKGKFRVMVATDIAARGIDVPQIEHVINFDVPVVAEDYLHRIGRTARAGRAGRSLCLVTPEERGLWRAIERLLGGEQDCGGGRSRPGSYSRPNSFAQRRHSRYGGRAPRAPRMHAAY
jgi:ATP-dependent RNA helicase DeaD